MDMTEIGQLICQARKKRKISQANLAQLLGMSRATISGIENATVAEVGVRKIIAICTVLGLQLVVQEKTQRPTLQQLLKEQHDAEELAVKQKTRRYVAN